MAEAGTLSRIVPSFLKREAGFRLALGVAAIVAARFAWLLNHAEKWDTPSFILLLVLCELPLAVAVFALTRTASGERLVRASGIAFGASVTFAVIIPPLFFVTMMSIWEFAGTYRGLVAFQNFLPICLISALWLAFCAFSLRRNNLRVFLRWTGAGFASLVIALVMMFVTSVPGSGEAKSDLAHQRVDYSGDAHVRAVAACLIRHKFLHPEEGFPRSLDAIKPDWNCDPKLADPWGLHGYWTLYSPMIDPDTHRAVDFRVQAIPLETGAWSGVDSRGEVLEYTAVRENVIAAQRSGKRPYKKAWGREGIFPFAYSVRDSIREYMRTHDPQRAPDSLSGVQEYQWSSHVCEDVDENEVDPQKRIIKAAQGQVCYKVNYFPPVSEAADTFALSVTCTSYGQECIRSYYMDNDGILHATAQPRPATAEDPGLEPCERATACDDPIWTSDEQPSKWIVFKANLLYSIHSI